ncbi:UNVERIFIED_CONTAM: hypothetical protein GTU68_052403, partial [Idotea baltica]|nr:hypothetical protein [Idotea baltica]
NWRRKKSLPLTTIISSSWNRQLRQLGLDNLIGTNVLRAVMHGYYMDVRLYNKAKHAANIVDKDKILKKKVKQKISEQNERKIVQPKKASKSSLLPTVNQEPFRKLKEESERGSGEKAELASELLKDDRFGALFTKADFNFDKETEAYSLIQPLSGKMDQRFKQMGDLTDEEEEEDEKGAASPLPSNDSSSDADSILSSEE